MSNTQKATHHGLIYLMNTFHLQNCKKNLYKTCHNVVHHKSGTPPTLVIYILNLYSTGHLNKTAQLYYMALKISVYTALALYIGSSLRVAECEIIEVQSTQQWYQHLRTANGTLSVAQFYVPWCRYCQLMKPHFVKIAADNPSVNFLSVNADEQRTLAWRMGITQVPAYKYFRNGRNIDTVATWRPAVVTDLIARLNV